MKDFVPYEQALELKELGYDEPCFAFYNHNGQLLRYMNPDKDWNSLSSQLLKNSNITIPDTYTAPTFSQAFRWFREKGIYFEIVTIEVNKEYETHFQGFFTKGYITYEEAELACLEKLIEIVKTK
jgi:hypothetical protein